ncbi:hypothetical protein SAMN04244567_03709 [Paracoccus pantotrophus]|nr:hypothetical protein SAMN04244567_03709 [Paracoccus pantotrophus]
MLKPFFLLMAFLPVLTACTGETPIRKTNCWSTMALVPMEDCEFQYVPAAK